LSILIIDVESFENVECCVHHDNDKKAMNFSIASLSSLSNIPFLQCILFDVSSPLYNFPSNDFQWLLCEHGIPVHDTDLSFSQMALLHHLVNGLCVYGSNKGCSSIANSSGVLNLALAVSEEILIAPSGVLRIIWKSLGYQALTNSQLIQYVQNRHNLFSSGCPPMFDTSLHGFKHMTKVELLVLATTHGLSPLGVINDIKRTVFAHIINGACGCTVINVPPACANF